MAKIAIVYDASEEIDIILKLAEDHNQCTKDEPIIYATIQKLFQKAFNEGRSFEKNIGLNPSTSKLELQQPNGH